MGDPVVAIVFIVFGMLVVGIIAKERKIRKEIRSFIVLMVCTLGIWFMFETAPEYGIDEGSTFRKYDTEIVYYWQKDYSVATFRSLPIVAFGVGVYLLFLRKGKQRKAEE